MWLKEANASMNTYFITDKNEYRLDRIEMKSLNTLQARFGQTEGQQAQMRCMTCLSRQWNVM